MSDKPVLLTVGGHTLRELWEPLSKDYDLAFLQTQAAMMAESMGIQAIALEKLLNEPMATESKTMALIVASEVIGACSDDGAIFDLEVEGLHGKGLMSWMPSLVYEHITTALARLHALELIASQRKIVGAFVHEDVTPEGRLICEFAKSIGIPALHLPHANHYIKPSAWDIHCQVSATHLGVSGEYMRDWYLACGVPPEHMTIVGTPQYDYLYDLDTMPDRDAARRAFHIPDGKKVVGYGTSWSQMTSVWGNGPAELGRCWAQVLSACQMLDAFLMVHVHYGEAGRQQHYADQMKDANVKGAVHRGDGLFWALMASDVVVVPSASNYGLEAAILGKPVVEMWTPGARFPEDGPEGTWGNDLVEVIDRAKPKPDWARRMNVGPGSADRAVEWVRTLCPGQ